MAKEEYCDTSCKFHKPTKIDTATNLPIKQKNFCEIGYLQISKTKETTINLIINGGSICLKNPWKSIAYQEKTSIKKGD